MDPPGPMVGPALSEVHTERRGGDDEEEYDYDISDEEWSRGRARTSVKRSRDGEEQAQCRLCKRKVKRGQGPSYGTTSLRKHMERHHKAEWDNRDDPQCEENLALAAAVTPNLSYLSSSQASSTGSALSVLSSSLSCPTFLSHQLSMGEFMPYRQHYSPSHPVVMRLNSHLAKLLVVQGLPYHLVDSIAFRELMGCAQPRWRIPSRHYFSKKAVPALHYHVEERVGHSMQLSVCSTVHVTVDTWSNSYGQGQYMSFTAHWVNILQYEAPPKRGKEIVVTPPRLGRSGSTLDNYHLSSSSSSRSSSTENLQAPTGHSVAYPPPSFHQCKVKHCHAVLNLLSLGEKSHTAEELLPCLQQELSHWLSARNLRLGNVVAETSTNIVAALRLGGMTHSPCIAHVLNHVVKRFLKRFVGLSGVLAKCRKVCVQFSHSYTFKHALLDLQRQNGLPQQRLICDAPTRLNSTLHMLDRLYQQRKAVTDYLMQQTDNFFWSQCDFQLWHWQLIRDTCRVLRPFEEATRFVSRDNSGINDVMPLIFLLEQTLAVMIEQGGMEEGSHLASSSIDGLLKEKFEEEDEEVVPEEELEMESVEEIGDKEPTQDDSDDDDDDDQPWQYGTETEPARPSERLAKMASCMLSCLRTDSRILSMKERDEYWIATFLDPRYKAKMGEFFPSSEREAKLDFYKDKLCSQLTTAFQQKTPADRGSSLHSTASASAIPAKGSSSCSMFTLEYMMTKFLHPVVQPGMNHHQRNVHHHLNNQVDAYLSSALSLPDTMSPDPMDFWVTRLDHWPELAQFAMGVLSCPPSSVASERVFNVSTPNRTRLSANNVEKHTFVQMNQEWISEEFKPPVPDATD
ncbi:zinc finger BED domain-containing protein 6-like [Hyla sarda]|uniref:zinc finger BED domain-containing protein 6-like n=1 Tax=Hyla sarda TaxID=327740 RepID=UPI0024C42C7C|nr:zinc finger BED domain-containing protein 6-like [Hyla sarda]